MKKNGETEEDNRDSGLLSDPLSFVRVGRFYWDTAGLDNRNGGYGYYWSLRSNSSLSSNYLFFASTSLDSQRGYNRGSGFAVRCKSILQILHHSH